MKAGFFALSVTAIATTVLVTLTANLSGAAPASSRVTQRKPAQANDKIENLLSRLTLDEKLALLGGTGFGSRAVKRLGIPAIEMIDGPQGIRGPFATAFPGMLTTVATWNPELMRKVAAGI